MKQLSKQVTCHDIEGNTYQIATKDLTFRPAVYGIIIQDKKILLSPQWDGYDFPGGGIEMGEPTSDALVREVKEETGLDVNVDQIAYANNSFFKLPGVGTYVHSIHLYYECTVTGGNITTDFFAEDEKTYARQAEWIPLSEVTNIKMCSSAKAEDVLRKFL